MPKGIPRNPKEFPEYLAAQGKRSRSSYTEENAARFKKVFDHCINLEKTTGRRMNHWLNPASMDLSLSTFSNRIAEALRWLIDNKFPNSLYSPQDYLEFRNKIGFKKALDETTKSIWGIRITYRKIGYVLDPNKDMSIVSDADEEESGNLKSELFKLKISEFFEDADKKILILKGIDQLGKALDADDLEWLKNTFESADIMYEAGSDYIKAVK